ncbi:MAG: DNA mismatch repair protein MutS [Treponema sp.]|nr:DNA mismatch repair protein MutS [Treponema sp.]
MNSDSTPMLDQYRRIKREHKNTVLFFRLGDFYEMFAEDAVEAAGLLNLTLTHRGQLPMCGVPYHAARQYIARLLKFGKKVAVCEQISEAGKGLVERKVIEVITPGTTVDEDYLDGSSANYLACIAKAENAFSFAYVDLSAGEFHAASFTGAHRLHQELERLQVKEVIVQESLLYDDEVATALNERRIVMNKWGDWLFGGNNGLKRVQRQFGSIKGWGLDETSPEIPAIAALLDYLDETAGGLMPHIKTVELYQDDEFVGLDESTQRNLELVKNLRDGNADFSLLEVMDQTRAAMGRRLLKRRILFPLKDKDRIEKRLEIVAFFYNQPETLDEIRGILDKTPDVERLRSRLAMDKAHGKDLYSIKNALSAFELLLKVLDENRGEIEFEGKNARLLDKDGICRLSAMKEKLSLGLCDNPSILLTEGNLIRRGFNAELDKLHKFKEDGRNMLEAYLEEERLTTGISSLKIRFNRQIGYFFEVTNAHLAKVPRRFIKRQGVAGGERYTTNRLATLESDINGADSKIAELESRLFLELREETKVLLGELAGAAEQIAELDVAQSLARIALLQDWRRPILHSGTSLDIIEARHPVVEAHIPTGEFIPNDIHLDRDRVSFALITGPNMAGKSTYLRQTALIVVMAQMGSFVPASEANVGLVDRVYCRVGASDNLARGESTFLVEMNETAYILNTATEKSLVIMDEVGRGTGTKDGLAIAWAVSEELLARRCRTLFATHYHELSMLSHPHLANRSMEVLDNNGELVFLRRLKEGAASESYGLHVAKFAGLNEKVLERANRIMEQLNASEDSFKKLEALSEIGDTAIVPPQGENYRASKDRRNSWDKVIAEIEKIDVDVLTPLDALNRLSQWNKILRAKTVVKPKRRVETNGLFNE